MKKTKLFISFLALVAIFYFAGPAVDLPNLDKNMPTYNLTPQEAEEIINEKETSLKNLKEDNESRIIWFDSTKQKTNYCFIYLHGFSASYAEGEPMHRELANHFGANLYLPRLYGHGLEEDEPMLDLTAEKLLGSTKEAIAISKSLGDSLVIIATSTGGTLALYLAENIPTLAGMVLYSPNIDIYDSKSWLLSKPWGLQIARLVKGSDYNSWPLDSVREKYWTNRYRLEALTELRALLDVTMTNKTFSSVKTPTLTTYYYKNDTAQDMTVSVEAIKSMFEKLGTDQSRKRLIQLPDVGHHVMASYLTSEDLESVRVESIDFIQNVIGIQPVTQKVQETPASLQFESVAIQQ